MTQTSIKRPFMPHNASRNLFVCLALGACTAVAGAQDLPKRPEQITYKPLSFAAPKASDYRHVLSNGTVVFLAPSNELPLVELEMTFKGGEYLAPAAKVGRAAMPAELLRTGGTESLAPSELDERLDFLATEASIDADATTCSASLDCLSSKFDESLSLLMDMLRRPRFDDDKRLIALDAAIEGMKQRNDDAGPILDREWAMHLYGADHFEARQPTEASMRGITKDDMAAFARRVFNPANVVVAVSGDFEPKAMLAKLEAAFADWPKGGRMPDPPSPPATFEAGVFR
ncbi:MAG: M16 family metallopeptidase, partial [Phycisphaerales bacterium]